MKITKSDSVKGIIGLLLIVLSISFVVSDEPKGNLKKNQLKDFPNTHEAPTSAEQLPKSNFKAPKLSASLLETDPTRRLRKSEFLETIKYAMYKLTRGEMEQIFIFVDQNKDDLIDHKEWDAFTALFILPFEACDKDDNHILTEEEFGECFDHDPKTKLIEFRRRHQDKKHELMMSTVSTRGANELNFADYLFVKKTLFGWQQCHSGAKYIAKSQFKCALSASIPQKYYAKLDYETIYRTGLKIGADRNLIELDFISYLRVMYFTYVFGVFNMPNDSAFLEKTQFLKGVKEDRLPNNFEESEIDVIYDLINGSPTSKNYSISVIDFESWSFFFALHRAFNIYSIEKPLQMNLAEFFKLLEDTYTSKEILLAIDGSFTRFEQSHYLEASLVLQRYRLNERDFFNARFKQDASVTTHSFHNDTTINATYYTITPNMTNREVFFTIFTDTNKPYWTKANLFRSFQLANLYVNVPGNAASTFIEKLPTLYDSVRPMINMKQRSNYVIYKAIPREVNVDLLTFCSLENYLNKLHVESMSTNVNIEETAVKMVLKDFGMTHMPDTVLDLSGKGYDSLRRRVFNPLEVAKNTIIVHAVASEKMRNSQVIIKNNLKLNGDNSRTYPTPKRRFESSPKV